MGIVFVLLSLSFLYSSAYERNLLDLNHHIKTPSFIFTLGNSVPTNLYDSYGSSGFTYKVVYEQAFENDDNFRYNFGWQNISFAENVVSYDDWSGLQVREGEKANLFDVGVKFIINEGLAGNGLFRPYINTSVGFGFFKQYTEYDYPDTFDNECDSFWSTLFHIIFEDDCDIETNYNINTVTDTRMSSSFMTLDLGTQFTFHNPSRYAIEFGIRYSMIRSIQASDWSSWDNIEDQQSFDQILGKKLKADYQTIYLGLSWYFIPPPAKQNNKGGYGKQI